MFSDPSGFDAIVANQQQNVCGYGHMSVFVQDENNEWYFFYWGNDSVSLTKVDNVDALSNAEQLNKWLGDKGLKDEQYKYDGFCYILGDFVETKNYYQQLVKQYNDDLKNNDIGWFGFKNKNYNLATRNCTQETMRGLYEGKIGTHGEQTVKDIYDKYLFGIAIIPNNNLYNLQTIFGSKTLHWWE